MHLTRDPPACSTRNSLVLAAVILSLHTSLRCSFAYPVSNLPRLHTSQAKLYCHVTSLLLLLLSL
jgi:hypothetical protein